MVQVDGIKNKNKTKKLRTVKFLNKKKKQKKTKQKNSDRTSTLILDTINLNWLITMFAEEHVL